MARCLHAPHRLILANQGFCGRCGGDVSVYPALRWMPELLYNDAHRLMEQGEREAAAALLQRVLALRADFPEALWLVAVIEAQKGPMSEARLSLERVRSLGAKVEMAWLDPKALISNDSPAVTVVDEIRAAKICTEG